MFTITNAAPRLKSLTIAPSWPSLIEQELEELYMASGGKKPCCFVIAKIKSFSGDLYVGEDELLKDPFLDAVLHSAKNEGYCTAAHMKAGERLKQGLLVAFLDQPLHMFGADSHAFWVQKYTANPVWKALKLEVPQEEPNNALQGKQD